MQLALRMKAARHLAGHRGPKGASPMANRDVARFGPLLDENVTANHLEEVEQGKRQIKRSELAAYIEALGLPGEWFDGLYPSDHGEASTQLGAQLLAIRDRAQGHQVAAPSDQPEENVTLIDPGEEFEQETAQAAQSSLSNADGSAEDERAHSAADRPPQGPPRSRP